MQQTYEQASTIAQTGKEMLVHPVLPLVKMVFFLFFSGPFKKINILLDGLPPTIEMEALTYDDPIKSLGPYVSILQQLEPVKKHMAFPAWFPSIIDEQGKPVNRVMALEAWIGQQVLTRELEKINSLLCPPCKCILCCCGPLACSDADKQQKKCFFEIPLTPSETQFFKDIEKIDTQESRNLTANSEPALTVQGANFYEGSQKIISWKNHQSLILPRDTYCPRLESKTGRCSIYEQRPDVCRRPQIFPYLLEKQEDKENTYMLRKKVLAVWDCPYVRSMKDEIAIYILLSGLEPVLMENKI